jgi:hypothetical protein
MVEAGPYLDFCRRWSRVVGAGPSLRILSALADGQKLLSQAAELRGVFGPDVPQEALVALLTCFSCLAGEEIGLDLIPIKALHSCLHKPGVVLSSPRGRARRMVRHL